MALLVAVLGYGCAAVFLGSMLLKPVFPGRMGLRFVLGTLSPAYGSVRDLAGDRFYMFAIFGGALRSLYSLSSIKKWRISFSVSCRNFARQAKYLFTSQISRESIRQKNILYKIARLH